MTHRSRIFTLLFGLFMTQICNANLNKDSLLHIWQDISVEDTVRASALNNLLREKVKEGNNDSTIFYAEKLSSFAKEIANDYYTYQANKKLGISYLSLRQYNKSINYFKNCLSYCQTTTDTNILKKTGFLLCKIGLGHLYQQNTDSALYYFEIITDLDNLKSTKKIKALALSNMAIIFSMRGDYLKSHQYNLKGYELNKKVKNQVTLVSIANNFGMIYTRVGDHVKALKWFRKAYYGAQKLKVNSNSTKALYNIGSTHKNLNQLDSAKYYFIKCYEEGQLFNSKDVVSKAKASLGSTYIKENNLRLAEKEIEEAIKLAYEVDSTNLSIGILLDKARLHEAKGEYVLAIEEAEKSYNLNPDTNMNEYKMIAAEFLSNVYSKVGKYEKAWKYHDIHKHYQKKKAIVWTDIELATLKTQFEYSEKSMIDSIENMQLIKQKDFEVEQERLSLENEKAKNKWMMAFLIIVLFGVVVILSGWRMSIRLREKINAQNILLNQKNKKINSLNSELEKRVKNRTQQLRTSLRKIRSHRYDLAHKIRGPLSSLIGLIELKLRDDSMVEDELFWEYMDKSVDQLDQVIREITVELEEEYEEAN